MPSMLLGLLFYLGVRPLRLKLVIVSIRVMAGVEFRVRVQLGKGYDSQILLISVENHTL